MSLTWDPALFQPQAVMAMQVGSVLTRRLLAPMQTLAFLIGFCLRGALGDIGCCGGVFCVLCQGAEIQNVCFFLICQARIIAVLGGAFFCFAKRHSKCSRDPEQK